MNKRGAGIESSRTPFVHMEIINAVTVQLSSQKAAVLVRSQRYPGKARPWQGDYQGEAGSKIPGSARTAGGYFPRY